jgi:hypothetical protein
VLTRLDVMVEEVAIHDVTKLHVHSSVTQAIDVAVETLSELGSLVLGYEQIHLSSVSRTCMWHLIDARKN